MNFPTYFMPEFEILDETFRGKNLEKMAFGTVHEQDVNGREL
jgi:hypothetical protein